MRTVDQSTQLSTISLTHREKQKDSHFLWAYAQVDNIDSNIIKRLVEQKASLTEVIYPESYTALQYIVLNRAIGRSIHGIMEFNRLPELLMKGKTIDRAFIYLCSRVDLDLTLLRVLLTQKADINYDNGAGMNYILHNKLETPEIIKLFVENKLDINRRDPLGKTILHRLATNNEVDFVIMEYLIRSGGNLNLTDNKGRLPLYAVCRSLNPFMAPNKLLKHTLTLKKLMSFAFNPLPTFRDLKYQFQRFRNEIKPLHVINAVLWDDKHQLYINNTSLRLIELKTRFIDKNITDINQFMDMVCEMFLNDRGPCFTIDLVYNNLTLDNQKRVRTILLCNKALDHCIQRPVLKNILLPYVCMSDHWVLNRSYPALISELNIDYLLNLYHRVIDSIKRV